MLTGEGKVRGDGDFIFTASYIQLAAAWNTPAITAPAFGDGDDEMLNIQLAKILGKSPVW